jgi:hypothetical protein
MPIFAGSHYGARAKPLENYMRLIAAKGVKQGNSPLPPPSLNDAKVLHSLNHLHLDLIY